jgi:hypothetical protein
MERKHVVAIAAAVAFSTNIPAADFQDAGPTTMFYVSIPLDTGISRKDQQPSFGLQLQGKREYQAIRIDSKILNFLPAGGLEAKWIIAGVLAAGAAVALGSRDKGTAQALNTQQAQTEQQQQQQRQQQQQQQQPQQQPCPPKPPACAK